jgi:MFS family permease
VAEPPAAPRAAFALFVLFLANTLNFFDRTVLSAVVEPLRKEWALSDGAVGWLGTAFTLLYAVVGLPLGHLADTGRRTTLLFAGSFLWSLMTALSGLLVGVGEAACAPASNSLLADLFPPAQRGRATAVFMLGLPVGLGLSYAVSGAVAQEWGWRATFFVAGVPGLFLSFLCLLLPEPPRGGAEDVAVGARRRPGSALALLLRSPTFVLVVVSGALHNFNMYALSTFLPAFLSRHHGLSVRGAGLVSGLVFGVVGGLGMLMGGLLADRVAARREAGRLLAGAACLGASVPLLLAMLGQAPGARAPLVLLLALSVLALYAYYAPVYATLQEIVEPALRGTAMAVYFFAMYLLGASLGPVGLGLLSDALAARAAVEMGLAPGAEAARAAGLHRAFFVVPLLGLVLFAVLLLAARTLPRDRRELRAWMETAA